MRLATVLVLLAAASFAGGDLAPLDCRVTRAGPGSGVTVDRGTIDGVAVGDRVRLFPRGGAIVGGFVLEVLDRSAVVELDAGGTEVAAGTRGEVLVPPGRLDGEGAGKRGKPGPAQAPGPLPEHPPWEREEVFDPKAPLLSGMKPLRPEERARQVSGLLYVIAEVTQDLEGEFSDSLFRLGTDLFCENPFGRGGRLHFNGEVDYLTETDEEEGLDLLVKRLSYAWGGTRFQDQRWEVGRFLQNGMPEFGFLDGAEWTRRRDNGHRYGLSLGFMPEPDDDFDTFRDFQVAGFYEWISDAQEQLVAAAGFQKSFHNGVADRDLVVARVRWLPVEGGWSFHGTAWIDIHTSGDAAKGSGLALTELLATLTRSWEGGHGIDVTVRHLEFPDMDRREFLPPTPAAVADSRYDTLAVNAWRRLTPDLDLRGHGAAYDDEAGSGGAGELEAEVQDVLLPGSRAFLSVFGTLGRFEDAFGVRGGVGRTLGRGRWDVFYEVSIHHLEGVDDDRDDLFQHRVRASGSVSLAPLWDLSAHAEGVLWDTEFTWSIGVSVQKRF
jgi:hypothetical protein